MPQVHQRIDQLQSERDQATRAFQIQAAAAQRQACLDQRSRLQKLAGMAGLDAACTAP